MSLTIKEIQEIHEYDSMNWQPIRNEARIDMQYVSGNPWTEDDIRLRGSRPTIAPEEMAQYRNQVVNSLMMNPRGMKFSPVGSGASAEGAKFYQSKAREIEYRSHATHAYSVAAENALMRSYGYVRVNYRRVTPRSVNYDIFIDPVPNPNMILPDTDFLRPDLSDMTRCFVEQWLSHARVKADYGSTVNFKTLLKDKKNQKWVSPSRAKVAEFWEIRSTKRMSVLVTIPGAKPFQMFADEFQSAGVPPINGTVVRDIEEIDYPAVYQRMMNAVDFVSEEVAWKGRYIPIIGCFGKVLYIDENGTGPDTEEGDITNNRIIQSMTRFGRDPWKAYCYACSQTLEVLGMVPRAPMVMYEGQASRKQYQNLVKSMSQPVAALEFKGYTDEYRKEEGKQPLPLPMPASYVQAQLLASLEPIIERFRRAIQSAMASNFLPTDAGKLDEKTGIALGNIQKAAERGTYHFVQSYEDLVRQVGVICEDLIPHIHDYEGETGVIDASGTSSMQLINGTDPSSLSTKGDYLVTVSAGQSSDSDREAATEFTDNLVNNVQTLGQIIGPEKSAAIIATSIRNRGLGNMGDQIADIIEPPEFKAGKNGEKVDPNVAALQAQVRQLQGSLQQAQQEKESKLVELQGQYNIAEMKEGHADARKRDDNETRMAVAALAARIDHMALLLEESRLVGARSHEAHQLGRDHAHNVIEGIKERAHEHVENELERQHSSELADRAAAQQQQLQQASAEQESAQ
jgi:hypothetical protein